MLDQAPAAQMKTAAQTRAHAIDNQREFGTRTTVSLVMLMIFVS